MIFLITQLLKPLVGTQLLHASWSEVPAILKLAFPIILGLTSSTLIGVVDTIMISPLGTEALAAASMTTSSLIIMYSSLAGLVSIVNIRMAQGEGANDPHIVSTTLKNGQVVALISGLIGMVIMVVAFPLIGLLNQPEAVMTVLQPYWLAKSLMLISNTLLAVYKGFFNAVNRPWTATVLAMFGVLINIPLNYLFIHGLFAWPGLGLLGAGIASVIASSSALLLARLLWQYRPNLASYRQPTQFSLSNIQHRFTEGLPVALSHAGEGASYALTGLMLGLFGPTALAANQVVHTIAAIMYMFPIGMSAAVGIRTGQAIGAQKLNRLRPIGIGATGMMLSWMLYMTAMLVLFRETIAGLLTSDPEVFTLAATLFLATAFMQLADGLQSTALGALRGMVDVRIPTIISLTAYWLIALPGAYIAGFVLKFGPNGVWIGYGLGIFLAAFALQIRFWRRTSAQALSSLRYQKA
ncbi:MAG: MATE family efflux transporter [Deinococcota bacterium]